MDAAGAVGGSDAQRETGRFALVGVHVRGMGPMWRVIAWL